MRSPVPGSVLVAPWVAGTEPVLPAPVPMVERNLTMELCEMCMENDGDAVVIDNNFETHMCPTCVKQLRKECEVTLL